MIPCRQALLLPPLLPSLLLPSLLLRRLLLPSPLLASLFLASLFPPGLAAAEPTGRAAAVEFRIPAGHLDEALETLARQAGIQILYAPRLVGRRQTLGLDARLPAAAALARLLEGSGLEAQAVGEGTYVLQRSRQRRPRAPADPAAQAPAAGMATVHVTGSHLPRSDIDLVTSAPISVISREEIEAGGYQTLFELLRLQPGMLGHHPVDVAAEGGRGFQQPFASASATSLNALGPRATLFLVNGRRVANYGLVSSELGGLVDLEGIPLSRVERVEILRGGASAIYGADAMAGVVNIILRRHQDGGEAGARYGLGERGDAAEYRLSASLGRDLAGGGHLLVGMDHRRREELLGERRRWRSMDHRRHGLGDWRIPLGYRDEDEEFIAPFCAPASDGRRLPCLLDKPRDVSLQPEISHTAFYAFAQRPIGERLQAELDLRLSRLDQRFGNPPFHARVLLPEDHPDRIPGAAWLDYAFHDIGPIRSHSEVRGLDLAGALGGPLREWEWRLDLSHHRNRVDNRIDGLLRYTAFEDLLERGVYRFGRRDTPPAVLAAISPPLHSRGEARLDQAGFGLHGHWFGLPGGPVRVAAGLELLRERLDHRPDSLILEQDVALGPYKSGVDSGRDGAALYLEFNLPLHRRFQAELAGRLDHREGYGNHFSPRLGLKWALGDALTLRASGAGGYRAPSLFELRRPGAIDELDLIPLDEFTSPCRAGFRFPDGSIQCLVLRSAADNPDLRPETSSSRTFGLVWGPAPHISLSLDRFRILRRNEIVPGSAYESNAAFPRSLRRDEEGFLVGVDDYFENVGRTEVDGWDGEFRYRLDTARAGRYTLRFGGQYLYQLRRQAWPGAPWRREAGHSVPRRSALASLQWAGTDWSAHLGLRYAGGMQVAEAGRPCPAINREAGKCRSPARYGADLGLAWAGLPGWRLGLVVRDLTDRAPREYDVFKGGYDIAWDDPRGRFYLLDARWTF